MQDKQETKSETLEESKVKHEEALTSSQQFEQRDSNEILVNPSNNLKEQKIKYTLMGKDIEIDNEAIVICKEYIEIIRILIFVACELEK